MRLVETECKLSVLVSSTSLDHRNDFFPYRRKFNVKLVAGDVFKSDQCGRIKRSCY